MPFIDLRLTWDDTNYDPGISGNVVDLDLFCKLIYEDGQTWTIDHYNPIYPIPGQGVIEQMRLVSDVIESSEGAVQERIYGTPDSSLAGSPKPGVPVTKFVIGWNYYQDHIDGATRTLGEATSIATVQILSPITYIWDLRKLYPDEEGNRGITIHWLATVNMLGMKQPRKTTTARSGRNRVAYDAKKGVV